MTQRTNRSTLAVAFCAHASAQDHFADPAVLRVIPHLSDMQPAQLRALVADTGLEVCTSQADDESRVEARQRCTTMTTAQLDDAALRRLAHEWSFGSGHQLQRSSIRCRHTTDGERCGANAGGPEGVIWYFRGTGDARRLIRVLTWGLTS